MKNVWRQWRRIALIAVITLSAAGIVFVVAPDRTRHLLDQAALQFNRAAEGMRAFFFGKPIDPSDQWFSAFILLQEGQAEEESGRHAHALVKYVEAKKRLDRLERQHPGFHSDLVKFRREQLARTIPNLESFLKGSGP